MAVTVEIVPASIEQAAVIADVIRRAFAEYAGRLRPESGALSETPASIERSFADHRILIAVEDGQVIGCVLCCEKGSSLYLGRLAVLPSHRAGGVASRLIAAVEAHARAIGAQSLSLGVRVVLTGNQAFFLRHGFREVGRSAHPGFVEPTSIEMEKALDPADVTGRQKGTGS
jgi:predicted N-acetyltransferase YhbS